MPCAMPEQNQTVGKRDVDEEPELEEPLRGVLEIEVLFRLDPIANLGCDRLFALVQITIERARFGEKRVPLAAGPRRSAEKALGLFGEKIAQILHVEIAQRRRLGLALRLPDEILDLALNAEAKCRDALVEERFAGARHPRRQIAADVETEETAQDDDAKNERERDLEGAARDAKTDVEEKNEKAKPAGVDVDLQPGRRFDERQERQLLARIEKGRGRERGRGGGARCRSQSGRRAARQTRQRKNIADRERRAARWQNKFA